jgi:hypothetical protein
MTIPVIAPPEPVEVIKQSVQEEISADEGFLSLYGGEITRGPLLTSIGNRQRLRQLYQFWHHDYNTLFVSAVAGLGKKIISTPWEIKGDKEQANYFQRVLMQADFGNWSRFISKTVGNYSRYDIGAFIEFIGPGKPDGPITGPITGMSILDTMRCWPTGDIEFPCLYYDRKGGYTSSTIRGYISLLINPKRMIFSPVGGSAPNRAPSRLFFARF